MKVMIALDDSLYSNQIIKGVLKRPWPANCEFKLITVLEPLHLNVEERQKKMVSEVQEMRREAARQYMTDVKKEFAKFAGSKVHFEIREGTPSREIIDSAVEWEPDRIVVGAFGRGSKERKNTAALGSTSQTVATHSPCTVEVIREPVPVKV